MTVRTILPLIILIGLILLFVTPVAVGENNAPPAITTDPTPEQTISPPDANDAGLPEDRDTPLFIQEETENASLGSLSQDASESTSLSAISEYRSDNSQSESVNLVSGSEQSQLSLPGENGELLTPVQTPSNGNKGNKDLNAEGKTKKPKINGKFVEDEILVKFSDATISDSDNRESEYNKIHAKKGTTVGKTLNKNSGSNLQLVKIPSGMTVDDAIALYENDPAVDFAEPNYIIQVSPSESNINEASIPFSSDINDEYFPLQWGLHNTGQEINSVSGTAGADINAPAAWEIIQESETVIIAVIDTGIDYSHPDIGNNIWINTLEIPSNGIDDDGNGYVDDIYGYNFVDGISDPMDDNGHGTSCAGVIGAISNNDIGISGVARDIKLMPLKFMNAEGIGTYADAIEAVEYARQKGADIISISWGSQQYNQAMKDEIDSSSMLFICAAGNNAQNNDLNPVYPASFTSQNIISVAASDQDDNLAPFSNWGPTSVDLASPGVNILSCDLSSRAQQYRYLSGTSIAVPFVSGVSGLVKANHPDYSATQIRENIIGTVDIIEPFQNYVASGGRLNAYNSLEGVLIPSTILTTVPTTSIPTTISTIIIPEGEPSVAPLNPDFVNYTLSPTPLMAEGDEDVNPGYLPSPVDRSSMQGQTLEFSELKVLSYPSSYDLRNVNGINRVTPVKNQGSCGSCWAFGTYGSEESVLMSSEYWDFSENNLKNTHGFDYGSCSGGNYDMSTAYLTRWSGPISETDDPYNPYSGSSPSGLETRKHVQDVLLIPPRSSSLDNDNIKSALMEYGAVSTSFYWNSGYLKTGNNYYYPGTAYDNHAVAIVGWDDNRVVSGAPGPGAFLIKNSWGTGWGDGGYFWISYYDNKMGKDENAVFISEPVDNYDNIYQYDPLGWTTSFGYYSTTAWGANVFTSTRGEQLKAVGFYALAPNTQYQVYIYKNPTSGPINSGGYVAYKSGTIAIPGFRTIPLDTPVALVSGDRYSIAVKLTTPGYYYPIALERPISGYSSGASASTGQSYISSSGSSWQDLVTRYANTNACIKGYTDEGGPPVADFIGTPRLGVMPSNVEFTDRSTGSPTSWQWNFGDSSANATTQNPTHLYENEGSYTVTLSVTNSFGTSTIQKVNYITVTPPPPFLSGWSYRKLHTISGSSSGDLTDYQVRFKVFNTTGTDSGENVYLGSNVKQDFSDLRFTTPTNALLPYWIQETGPNYAIVWVKVPTIPVTGTQMYLYYGNGGALAVSSGAVTFPIFDDFTGSSLDTSNWTTIGTSATTTSGYLHVYPTTQNGGVRSKTIIDLTVPAELQARARWSGTSQYNMIGFSKIPDLGSWYNQNGVFWRSSSESFMKFSLYYPNEEEINSIAKDTNWHWLILNAGIGKISSLSLDDSISYSTTHPLTGDTYYIWMPKSLSVTGSNHWTDIDWVFLRYPASQEPSHSSWGSEENII